jgi:hypothetical protein
MTDHTHHDRAGESSAARLILALVVLAELALFAAVRYVWWQARAPERPLTLTGEGFAVRGDGLGYYAWLRSLLIDGDWDFANEFDEHNALGDDVRIGLTELGRRENPFSVGPACAWSLGVVPVHLFLEYHRDLPWPADGYSLPYQLASAASGPNRRPPPWRLRS